MYQMPPVWGNVDKNDTIHHSSNNFKVDRTNKGRYQVTYSGTSFDYPPCVLATSINPDTDEGIKALTLQENTKDGFEIYFKDTGGNFKDAGFNFAVFYNTDES